MATINTPHQLVGYSDYWGVPLHAAYEAWKIAGTGGLYVVCTPGGSLSLWQPARDGNKL